MLQQLCWRLLIALSRSDHVLSWKVENEDQIKLVLSGNWLKTYSIKKTYLSKDQKKKQKKLLPGGMLKGIHLAVSNGKRTLVVVLPKYSGHDFFELWLG